MLRSLTIKNLVLIGDARLEFSQGLNVLSGETGAVIAKLPQNTINRLNEYVYNYGFCFQICDDFADIKEKGEVSSQSIVSLYGPEKSKKMAIEAADNAKKSLVMSGINSDFFTGLIDKLVGILVD